MSQCNTMQHPKKGLYLKLTAYLFDRFYIVYPIIIGLYCIYVCNPCEAHNFIQGETQLQQSSDAIMPKAVNAAIYI